MIKPIAIYKNDILRTKAKEYKIGSKVSHVIDDILETMLNANGAGIAAPQIGVSKRLFITKIGEDSRKVFINPIIHNYFGEKMIMKEGCLSIPGVEGEIVRKDKILMSYYDKSWNFHENIEFSGVKSRIIQHEYDHLEGKLWIDRIENETLKKIFRDIIKISKGEITPKYPIIIF